MPDKRSIFLFKLQGKNTPENVLKIFRWPNNEAPEFTKSSDIRVFDPARVTNAKVRKVTRDYMLLPKGFAPSRNNSAFLEFEFDPKTKSKIVNSSASASANGEFEAK